MVRRCIVLFLALGQSLAAWSEDTSKYGSYRETLISIKGLQAKSPESVKLIQAILNGEDPKASDEVNNDRRLKIVTKLYDSGDFDGFELLCTTARKRRLISRNGTFLVGSLYSDFETATEKHRRKDVIERFQKWVERRPRSVTARVCLGKQLISWAWDARGSDVSSNVSREGWARFSERLTRAKVLLEEAGAQGEGDVYPYVSLITVGMGLSLNKTVVAGYFAKATAIDPIHSVLPYQNMAMTLLPRWGGGPGEVEAFADKVANSTRKDLGDSLYALTLSQIVLLPGSQKEVKFNWPRMKNGFEEYLRRNPRSDTVLRVYWLNAAAFHDEECLKNLAGRVRSGFPNMSLSAAERASFEPTMRLAGAAVSGTPPPSHKPPERVGAKSTMFNGGSRLFVFIDPGTGLYGYKEADGKLRVAPTMFFANPYIDGLALVYSTIKDDKKHLYYRGKCGYINSAGQFVIAPQKGYTGTNLSRGYFLLRSDSGEEYFRDSRGDAVPAKAVPEDLKTLLRREIQAQQGQRQRSMP